MEGGSGLQPTTPRGKQRAAGADTMEEDSENEEQEDVQSTSLTVTGTVAVLASDSHEDDEAEPLSRRAKRARTAPAVEGT